MFNKNGNTGKFFSVLITALLISTLFAGTAFAEITKNDYRSVVKITKKLRKLSDNNDIKGISKYYSDNYKSFDGYNKDQIMEIFETARRLYPTSKTKEKILKVKEENGLIKVFIDETSSTKIVIKGEEASYSENEKIAGLMTSSANYSMIYKKEDGKWLVVGDEIYDESTDIRYGDALESDFQMDAPDTIKPGTEFTVKTLLEVPKDVFAVGSIGHDKIIYPPEKYWDPYRAFNPTGVLERVMVANKDGINEYANATFAFVKAPDNIKDGTERAVISGMGFYVKRMNMQKDEL